MAPVLAGIPVLTLAGWVRAIPAGGVLRVLIAMAAECRNGRWRGTRAGLAAMLGLSERSVSLAWSELSAAGLIVHQPELGVWLIPTLENAGVLPDDAQYFAPATSEKVGYGRKTRAGAQNIARDAGGAQNLARGAQNIAPPPALIERGGACVRRAKIKPRSLAGSDCGSEPHVSSTTTTRAGGGGGGGTPNGEAEQAAIARLSELGIGAGAALAALQAAPVEVVGALIDQWDADRLNKRAGNNPAATLRARLRALADPDSDWATAARAKASKRRNAVTAPAPLAHPAARSPDDRRAAVLAQGWAWIDSQIAGWCEARPELLANRPRSADELSPGWVNRIYTAIEGATR